LSSRITSTGVSLRISSASAAAPQWPAITKIRFGGQQPAEALAEQHAIVKQ